MDKFIKSNWFKVAIIVILLFNPFFRIDASNYKVFVVKEIIDYDKLLVTDDYSQYIVDLGFGCSTYSLYAGSVILIDTYFSPSFYDDVIIKTAYGTDTCTISDSEEVNLKRYFVESVIDSKDEIIVEDNISNRYLVEYGIGCLSMWRYESKYIDIDIGGSFLDGISDQIYLFDSDDDCKVWDADELSGGGTGSYAPPSNLTKTCPINSSLVGTGCFCNDGYVANGSVCITYSQACQNQYGTNTNGDKTNCYCNAGYQWNSPRTACVQITCLANSFISDGQCKCNFGYIIQNGSCVNHTTICKNQFGEDSYGDGTNCYCSIGAQWNSTKTTCIKIGAAIPVTTTTEKTAKEAVKETKGEKQLKQTENIKQEQNNQEIQNTESIESEQEENKSYLKVKEEKRNNESFISWSKIFNSIKNFWKSIFK
ncbi:MAG: hypothetical protein A3D35_01545 [Candidatus Staskawiczbacteria bacterium RIFCSPHIGHO2_02_FULL_34_9]|uniref:Uncharacterized protein n=1 Tax=Candidatus Staskawiczbacteria bacterium RIFCSPHIGHO2_02_FULL_34_9 TaxID=1802206 RepID=A0A1G2HXA2_9BACT|nr:MAG: hypothetical protein A3D35_01545 [Candidatus Staskawiczbacteria bacterium RIFCSPHIGHO2_02_FULL_34_9]